MRNLFIRLSLLFWLPVSVALASGGNLHLEKAHNDLKDQASLQRGAVLFSEYCLSCHSVKYMRYNRIARDLGWSEEEVMQKFAFGQGKVVDNVKQRIPVEVEHEVFGTVAPDLSLMARLKGTDYIYTFIQSFEQTKEGRWDNKLLHGTAMPNALEGLQRHLKKEEVEHAARDIANFLEYVGEPAKLVRWDLGWKVLLYLAFLFVLAYLLKKEYWRDVH